MAFIILLKESDWKIKGRNLAELEKNKDFQAPVTTKFYYFTTYDYTLHDHMEYSIL